MKMQKLFGLVIALALLATLNGGAVTFASRATVHDTTKGKSATKPSEATLASSTGPIIIDHTCTDLSKIPDYWLEQAKDQLRLSYGHTSHGSQPVTGMQVLENGSLNVGGLYDFNTNGAVISDTLSLDDYTPSGDLGHNGDTSWADRTRTYLDGTGSDRNVVVWSWCGGVSDNSEAGINTYLSAMNQLEQDYPNVAFVYMTGHLDGSGEAGNLNVRNEQIRDYCIANNKILFDFADIESYDPDGNYYLDQGADDNCDYDSGNWANEWCAAHSGDPLCDSCSCNHSRPLNCNLKARAFWWMMARLAGWSGPGESQKAASAATPVTGQTVTYTIVIQNLEVPLTATVYLTDEVPSELSYVPSTLTATTGIVTDASPPTLRWSGLLSPTPAITVTYAVTVSTTMTQTITNRAVIAAPGYQTITRTATIVSNGYPVYLPLVLKNN